MIIDLVELCTFSIISNQCPGTTSFCFVDHTKNDKVYTNLSSAQTTIVDISEHSWTRTVLDDYESGQNLNVFLSCYSLRLTNIAVIANPSSSTSTSSIQDNNNRRKKVAFCCMDLSRIWPGCSDSTLLDARKFDIEEIPESHRGIIRDESNDHNSFSCCGITTTSRINYFLAYVCQPGLPDQVRDKQQLKGYKRPCTWCIILLVICQAITHKYV